MTPTMAPSAVALAEEDAIPIQQAKDNALGDAIEKIIIACEGRKDARSAVFEASKKDTMDDQPSASGAALLDGGGSLSSNEIAHLSRLCTAVSSFTLSDRNDVARGFGAVDGDLLASLFQLLEEHVRSAAHVDLVNEACQALEPSESGESVKITIDEWLKGSPGSTVAGPGMKRIAVLKNGLESASILLSAMTSSGVDRRLTSEDCIEACIALFRHHLSKNIIPAISNTGHIAVAQSKTKNATDPSPPKKQKKSPIKDESKEQRLMRSLKKVYKHIIMYSNLFLGLVDQIDVMIQSIPLDDRPLLTLVTAALSVFAIEPPPSSQQAEAGLCRLLHVSSIGLIPTIFQKYPQHRTIVIEDLFPLMLKLPSSKKSLRTFSVHSESDASGLSIKRVLFPAGFGQDQQCIQAISALILALVQCCVQMPTFQTDDEATKQLPQLKSGLVQCQSVCNFFASQLLQRCARKGEDGGSSEYRPILGNLVDDLLLLLLSPEYPGAGMLLLTLNNILSNDVLKASSITTKSSNSVESTYLSTAFDVLGKTNAATARILAAYRAKPPKIASGDKENKSSNKNAIENSCHCGRPSLVHAFMVNCDSCHDWYHGECVGITKDNVSRVWMCDDCRLRQMVVEETKAFAERSRRHQLEGDSDGIDDSHIFRQLLLNHLTEQAGMSNSPAGQFARQMRLAQWIEEVGAIKSTDSEMDGLPIVQRLLCDHFLEQWDGPLASQRVTAKNHHSLGGSSCRCLNREGNVRLMINLAATNSGLVLSFPRQLGLIIQLMADEGQVSMRKLSVKAISQVIEADPTLMLHPAVKRSVSQRFRDDAKSVREAAVTLVGTFVVQTPEVANAFHSSLIRCLTDSGVSVKKRTIRIFRDVLLSNPLYKGRAAACAVLLRLAADPKEDDSVRDLIHEFFTELWLESDTSASAKASNGARQYELAPSSANQPRASSVSRNEVAVDPPRSVAGIVTPLTPRGSNAITANPASRGKGDMNGNSSCSPEHCRGFFAMEQMVEVVMAADSKDALTALLKELMFGFTDADKDRKASERRQKNDALHSHCSSLVNALMEQLLILEENRSVHGESFGKKLVAVVRTISVFGEVAPAEVLRHVDTITPYLKAENSVSREQESQIVSEICELIFRLLPVMTGNDIMRLGEGGLVDDLVSITYKFGSGPLTDSMRALAGLANHAEVGSESVLGRKLMKLVTTFYGYLMKVKRADRDFSTCDLKTRNNVSRALSVLGAFCRNHEIDEEEWPELDDVEDLEIEALSLSNIMYACYRIFAYYLQQTDVDTKCAALRALIGIFMSRPRVMLMLEQNGTIGKIMSQESPAELQLESLRCWRDLLLVEEKRVESGDAKARMEARAGVTVSKRISGDQDGDATLIGGVLTQHAPRLFQMTTSQDHRIRLAAVDLLGHLLRQGLLNPMETVPYLFALQGDVQAPSVRELALKLLIVEGEKRPDMLRQRVCDGVKQAYLLQRTVYSSKLDVTAVVKKKRGKSFEVECIFGSVFKDCIRSSKKQRQGLYRNLLGLFTSDDASDELMGRPVKSVGAAMEQELPLLSFAAQILAHLPYNTASDPLFIIHQVSSTAAIQGAQLLDRLSSFLRKYGLSGSDEFDDHNTNEDVLEKAAKGEFPSRKKDVTVVNKASFDAERFAKLCGEASAIVLLLRLKLFLRKVYNLSETRCLEYSPDANERICDKGVSAPADMPVFNGSLEMRATEGTKGPHKTFEKDALIRRYAEFRRLMRSEHGSDAQMSDSDDSPTSRKRKGGDASTPAN